MSNPKTTKPAIDRRTRGERRNRADSRREHDRFSTGKKSNDRRETDRRGGRS
jgi:hypothetical protein